eukprot:scaffold47223_cov31-Tisochrysis_lutea.AAC.2
MRREDSAAEEGRKKGYSTSAGKAGKIRGSGGTYASTDCPSVSWTKRVEARAARTERELSLSRAPAIFLAGTSSAPISTKRICTSTLESTLSHWRRDASHERMIASLSVASRRGVQSAAASGCASPKEPIHARASPPHVRLSERSTGISDSAGACSHHCRSSSTELKDSTHEAATSSPNVSGMLKASLAPKSHAPPAVRSRTGRGGLTAGGRRTIGNKQREATQVARAARDGPNCCCDLRLGSQLEFRTKALRNRGANVADVDVRGRLRYCARIRYNKAPFEPHQRIATHSAVGKVIDGLRDRGTARYEVAAVLQAVQYGHSKLQAKVGCGGQRGRCPSVKDGDLLRGKPA